MEEYRVALIGCGAIAGIHAQSLRNCTLTRLSALCDIRRERAEALAATYAENAAVYSDWHDMLDQEKPDAVHICTPHFLHAEMALEALRRGIHVYLEKPVSITEEELDSLLAAERKSRARITVSFQNRMLPEVHAFFSAIRDGGGPAAARCLVTWCRGREYYTADDWHGVPQKEGGGLMINQAIHALDLLLCAFPEAPVALQGSVALYDNHPFSRVEDNAQCLITFPGGEKACLYATNDFPLTASNYFEVFCKDGSLVTLTRSRVMQNGVAIPIDETLPPLDGKVCWGSGHLLCIRAFYEAIRNGGEVPVPLISAARTMRTLFALYRSENARIPLDLCKES